MMGVTETGLSEIAQIAVVVHDTPRAVEFYRDKLGMKLLFTAPGNLAFFDCRGIRLMLSPAEKPEHDHPSSVIYFKVEDINRDYAVLRSRGVVFEGEPHVVARLEKVEIWMAFFSDLDNNLLAITEERPR